jgi:hypothetical protein
VKSLYRSQVQMRNTDSFHRSFQGGNERSKFSQENSQSREDYRIQRSCKVDKDWMKPSLWYQESMWIIDHDLF